MYTYPSNENKDILHPCNGISQPPQESGLPQLTSMVKMKNKREAVQLLNKVRSLKFNDMISYQLKCYDGAVYGMSANQIM